MGQDYTTTLPITRLSSSVQQDIAKHEDLLPNGEATAVKEMACCHTMPALVNADSVDPSLAKVWQNTNRLSTSLTSGGKATHVLEVRLSR